MSRAKKVEGIFGEVVRIDFMLDFGGARFRETVAVLIERSRS